MKDTREDSAKYAVLLANELSTKKSLIFNVISYADLKNKTLLE